MRFSGTESHRACRATFVSRPVTSLIDQVANFQEFVGRRTIADCSGPRHEHDGGNGLPPFYEAPVVNPPGRWLGTPSNQIIGVLHALSTDGVLLSWSRWSKGGEHRFLLRRERVGLYRARVFGVDLGGHMPCLDHLLSVPARGQSPHLACALWRRRHQLRTRPFYEVGRLRDPGRQRARSTTGDGSNSFQHDLLGCVLCAQATFRRAPSETNPASTNRHRSTSNRRASATMPMRRWRLLPPPKRSWNQRVCLLFGW